MDEVAYALGDELDLLLKAVGVRLDRTDRRILVGRLGAKYGSKYRSQQEIADVIGMSQPGVSNRERQIRAELRRARRRLRKERETEGEMTERVLALQQSVSELSDLLGVK